jgi:hypothetical protein
LRRLWGTSRRSVWVPMGICDESLPKGRRG